MYNLSTGAPRAAMVHHGGMHDFGPTGGTGFRFQGIPGMRDLYDGTLPGTPPVTVSGQINGQTVSGTGHSTRDAWLGFANNALGSIMGYLNSKQNLQIAQIRANIGPEGQPTGAAGAVTSITNWMSANPLLVVAIGAGLFLLLAPSPRKGR